MSERTSCRERVADAVALRAFIAVALAAAGLGTIGAGSACAQAAADDAAGTADAAVLQEIIVTAQRRSQNLQDVPIAIDVVSQQALQDAGVGDITDAFSLIAGVNLETFGTTNQSNLFIRGVGSSLLDGGVEHSVGMYVDDIYIGGQQAFNVALFDFESIEVLRGPQGTLYGKNALGGAIRFSTVRPRNELSGSAEVSYGNYDYYEVRGVLNAPLAEDRLLVRATGALKRRDGIIDNGVGADLGTVDSTGGRLQLRAFPTDALTIDLAVDYAHDEPVIAEGDFPDTIESRRTNLLIPVVEDRDSWGFSAAVTAELSGLSITSLTAYRGWEVDTISTGDVLNGPAWTEQDIEFEQISQEFRFASTGQNALQWVAGLYYYHDTGDYTVPFQLVSLASEFGYPDNYRETSIASLETDTYAAFLDATYAFTERLSLSAGVRFTREQRSMAYRHESSISDPDFQEFIDLTYGPDSGLVPSMLRFAPLMTASPESEYSDVSPRLVLSYRWNDALLTYASISKGFKSGGFNALFVASDAQLAFEPEEAVNYEIGMKSDLFANRLRLNAAVYYFDWEDLQARSVLLTNGGTGFAVLVSNAAQVVNKGVDLDVTLRAAPGLDLGVGYSYIDATFDSFPDAPSGDLSGNRLPFISKHNARGTVSYRWPLGVGLSGLARFDYAYRTSYFVDNDNTADFETEPRGLLDARLGLEGDRWEFSLWGKNLLDKKYHTYAEATVTGLDVRIGEPRTYGVRGSVKF